MNSTLEKIFSAQQSRWQREGWDVFSVLDRGCFEIQRIDDPDSMDVPCEHTFDSDDDAFEFVVGASLQSSLTHLFALWIDGKILPSTDDADRMWIPDVFHSLASE